MNVYYQRFKTIEHKFWEKVDIHGEDECWEWIANKNDFGYGRFNYKDKHTMAHRVAYDLTYGEIPEGMFICHHCDNPSCCNPKHLFLGTRSDNMQDMWNKKRHPYSLKDVKERAVGELNGKCVLTEKDVYFIRYLHYKGVPLIDISRMYPVVQKPAIHKIIMRRTWKHLEKGANLIPSEVMNG